MALSSWPALTLQLASERPQAIADVLEYREECRAIGRLSEAQAAQGLVEDLKHEENSRRMKILLEAQAQQADNLEADKVAEYDTFLTTWNARFEDLRMRAEEQIEVLEARHADELDDHRRRAQMSETRYYWSPTLQHVRRCQEALIQQNEFAKAEKIRAWGDAMEADEVELQRMQWQHKLVLDEAKLSEKQARETDALRKRLATMENECLVAQEREHDKLMKTCQTSRHALQRTHAQEVTGLTQALKGWMNTKRTAPSASRNPALPSYVPAVLRSRRPVSTFDMQKVFIGGPSSAGVFDEGWMARIARDMAPAGVGSLGGSRQDTPLWEPWNEGCFDTGGPPDNCQSPALSTASSGGLPPLPSIAAAPAPPHSSSSGSYDVGVLNPAGGPGNDGHAGAYCSLPSSQLPVTTPELLSSFPRVPTSDAVLRAMSFCSDIPGCPPSAGSTSASAIPFSPLLRNASTRNSSPCSDRSPSSSAAGRMPGPGAHSGPLMVSEASGGVLSPRTALGVSRGIMSLPVQPAGGGGLPGPARPAAGPLSQSNSILSFQTENSGPSKREVRPFGANNQLFG